MLGADERHDFIRTFYADLGGADFRELERTVAEMAAESASALANKKGAEHRIHLDLRYVGQEFTLSVPVTERQVKAGDRRAIRTAFDRLYDQRYAHHSPEEPVEIVNIRLAVIGKRATLKFPRLAARSRVKPFRKMQAHLGDPARPVSCPVYRREELGAGARIAGPALVPGDGTTTVLFKGELLAFAMVRAHWIDVGGTSTGFGAGPEVPDPWQEGLQLDQLKIYDGGRLDQVLYRVIRDNIRFPESSLGDMNSQIASCKLGIRRLDELVRKYGRDTLLRAIARIFDETERKCRNFVARLADGVYEAESFFDDDGVTPDERVRIHAKVTVRSGNMTIDLSGCSSERKAAVNSRTLAGARVAYKALTGPLDPVNEGSFRALEAIIPEGNIMMARYPAPMAGLSSFVPTVVETIISSPTSSIPDRIPPAHHRLLRGSVVFVRRHPTSRRRFVVQSIEGGGWGGRPFEDGESATVSVCQGDVRNGSIEGIEMKCPGLVKARALRRDSAGAGKVRGGLGIDMQACNFVDGQRNFERANRRGCPAWGLLGGGPGESGGYYLRD